MIFGKILAIYAILSYVLYLAILVGFVVKELRKKLNKPPYEVSIYEAVSDIVRGDFEYLQLVAFGFLVSPIALPFIGVGYSIFKIATYRFVNKNGKIILELEE